MPLIEQGKNGDAALASQQSNGKAKPYTNGEVGLTVANDQVPGGYEGQDAFQHLPNPQQEVLLLHGPRQKYSLQTTGQIPELRAEREILIQVCEQSKHRSNILTTQVVAIGLNPVDWKAPYAVSC